MQNFDSCIKNILSDIRVELREEFDNNFRIGGFFESGGWRRSSQGGAKTTLVDTGALRRSIRAQVSGNSVSFSSSLPYASIHNEGGIILVTTKMKKYFWAKYIEATGSLTTTKTGKLSQSKKNKSLSSSASFYKAMALKKVGSKIVIPQRQFIGFCPHVKKRIEDIALHHIEIFLKNNLPKGIMK